MVTPYAPAPPPRRTSPLVWIAVGIGTFFILLVGVGSFTCVRWCSRAADGGVTMGAQTPNYAVEALRKKNLLAPGEDVLAYYDASLSVDGTEVAFITKERVVHSKDGRTVAMRLAEVSAVEHRTESLIGDIIEVKADSGERMKIEIAPMNDGPSFVNVLKDAWANHRADASVKEVPAP